MDIQSSLIELEETAQKISDGLAAIHIMILGMDEGQYAGAFHAVWSYLSDADMEFQRCLSACLDAV